MAWRPFSDLGTTVSWGLAGGRHLLEDRRQGDLDSAADRINGWAGSGAQSGSATILFDLDLTEVGKIVDDALPFELATACRQTVRQFLAQHQGEEGAEDVAADAGIGFVEDRPGGEQRLCGFEGVLHGEEVAVSQDDLEGGDFRIGAQHEQAVEAGVGLDLGQINDKAVALGRLEKTAEALVGDERLVAVRELALETGDQFGARLGILSGFLVVATDDVAPAGDCGLPDGEFSL